MDYSSMIDENGCGEPEVGEAQWEEYKEGMRALGLEHLREDLEKEGYSKEDIDKVIDFFSKSKEHAEDERLVADFDEQRLAEMNEQLNRFAEDRGLSTPESDESVDEDIYDVFG